MYGILVQRITQYFRSVTLFPLYKPRKSGVLTMRWTLKSDCANLSKQLRAVLYNVQVAERPSRMLELLIDNSDDKVLRPLGYYWNYVDTVLRGIHRTESVTNWKAIVRIYYSNANFDYLHEYYYL